MAQVPLPARLPVRSTRVQLDDKSVLVNPECLDVAVELRVRVTEKPEIQWF